MDRHQHSLRVLHRALPTALVLAATLAFAASAHAGVDVRQIDAEFPIDGQRMVFLNLPVGEFKVVTGGTDRVVIEALVRCSRLSRRCRDRAEAIELAADERPSSLELHFEGYPNHNMGGAPALAVTLTMPEHLDLELEIGVGDVTITGLQADVRVDLGVGDVLVRMDKQMLSAVYLDVGVGSADLEPEPSGGDREGFFFLGNELRWEDGPGRAEVEIEVGVGKATVRME